MANPWKTLQEVVEQNLIESYQNTIHPYDPDNIQLAIKNEGAPIKAGDTLVLLNGLHGELVLANYNNTKTITIIAAEGQTPIVKKVLMQACKNWKLEGLTI
ncbi:MAG TPA: hypothetical protein ENJ53_08380, partial [Phaeodactylibacter sp.]|nr:hypothetical protein [Phaeodactylibacter sp.]